ncbi:NAD(P)-dependent alcohol dehydrogenase [Georgenia sp. Z1344]|uniref:NAD(P)-dependent alcohol dehydrogenase n=1 Tax=Georgenia sp. Z1344 TaxID=3416706 RepID=UPI003CF28961
MRAVVVDRYGPPTHAVVTRRPFPEPRADEILVRVEAAAVTAGDARLRSGTFPPGFTVPARLAMGIRGPRIQVLGNSFAGVVEKTGADVDGFSPGDRVAGMSGFRMGTHAEHVRVRTKAVAHVPEGVSDVDAAAVLFGGTTALHFLRDLGQVQAGESVLVNGASGAVGTSAVQVARHLGARVTAVTSAGNADLVRRLGAAAVVDYRTTPVTELTERFDVVLDAVGNLSRSAGRRLLTGDGRLLVVVGSLAALLPAKQVHGGTTPENARIVTDTLDLLARGELDPVVEVMGGLEAVVEAYRRIDSGHKVGNLVVTPHGPAATEDGAAS